MVIKIVNGGQTGVERAALDVAMNNDIACGGWCPKGRRAEDGALAEKYPLVEGDTPSPTKVFEQNVRDSDGTLLLGWGDMQGTTLKVVAIGARLKKPIFYADLQKKPTVDEAENWARKFNTKVLHVSGAKTSEVPSAYEEAHAFLMKLLVGE